MSGIDDEGGDPACWLHLFEDDEPEDPEARDGEAGETATPPSGTGPGDGDPGGDRSTP